MQETLEIVAAGFAAVYLLLVIRQNVWCWPTALISVSLFMFVYFDARLYMQSGLQIYYFVISIYGWLQWVKGGEQQAGVRVHWWSPWAHVAIISSIVALSLLMGRVLSGTDSDFPYLDSFATIAALFTTFMVARKVIENWIYWFVIDGLLVYLFWQSDLHWNALLYLAYLVMVVIGFFTWLKHMRADGVETNDSAAA